MPSTISCVQRPGLRLHLEILHLELAHRQHRVVARVIGIVAGRAVDRLAAAVAHREVVGGGDGFAVGDQEADHRPAVRRPGPHLGDAARLAQIDRRLAADLVLARRSPGRRFSCVPQPSSAGWQPSPTKPGIDQVLQNSPGRFGTLVTCRSCSATWITLVPVCCISLAQPSRVVGLAASMPRELGDVEQRLLDEVGDEAGIGAVGDQRRRAVLRERSCAASSAGGAGSSWCAALPGSRCCRSSSPTARCRCRDTSRRSSGTI